MNTKNLMLGAIAGVFAVGASFASTLLVTPQSVKIGPVPPASNCKLITAQDCGAAGPRACRVTIDGTTYQGYSDTACSIAQTTSRLDPVDGEFVNP